MNAADRRRLTPVLGILAVLLVLVVLALWLGIGRGVHWHDDATPPRLPAAGAATPPPMVPPLERYAEVWQRPLFSPDRAPEQAAGSDASANGDLELTGVVMLPGLDMAIVHDRGSNQDYRVIKGRPAHNGPALVELHARSAVLESGGTRVQLHLVSGPAAGGSTGGADGAGQGASAMVTRPGNDGVKRQPSVSGTEAERARARAARQRAAQQDDGGD